MNPGATERCILQWSNLFFQEATYCQSSFHHFSLEYVQAIFIGPEEWQVKFGIKYKISLREGTMRIETMRPMTKVHLITKHTASKIYHKFPNLPEYVGNFFLRKYKAELKTIVNIYYTCLAELHYFTYV